MPYACNRGSHLGTKHGYFLISPVHCTSLGSGSHSPFAVQTAVLDPTSIDPGGQLKVTLVPSVAGNTFWPIIVTVFSNLSAGFPQLLTCARSE